jgi:hypothetical protein
MLQAERSEQMSVSDRGGSGQVREGATSLSESLAHGLASKMAAGVRERTIRAAERVGGQAITVKRAAAYRSTRDRLKQMIPPSLMAMQYEVDGSGKDKRGFYMSYSWDTADAFERMGEIQKGSEAELILVSNLVRAKDSSVTTLPVCAISRHALMRLFYRLKTGDEAAVMVELKGLASALWTQSGTVRQASIEAELLIPTPHGAFVVVLDARRPGECIAKTWMSDARMMDNMRRLHAVFVARAERGMVVNHIGGFPVISEQRLQKNKAKNPKDPDAKDLNDLCDSLCPEKGKIPWSWRFRDWRESLSQQLEAAGYGQGTVRGEETQGGRG